MEVTTLASLTELDTMSTLTSLADLDTVTEVFTMAGNLSHAGNGTAGGAPHKAMGGFGVLVKVVYAIGIVGNACAIIALRRGERRVRNRKHLLLLTSLAANDLVALVGMMCAMLVAEHVPGVGSTRAYCAARVVLRVFGIGSVCIAVTMALERYLALTRPFLYQKQVTYYVIRMALLVSWFWAACLTCAPILGLGLYYDDSKCVRYRNAETPTDFAYAVFYVAFGTVLCLVLVYCNLAVIRALYAITAPRGSQPVVRRVSKSSCRQRARAGPAPHHHNAATAEEVAFSRLMATLSVLFMICWLPQMLTSALFLGLGPRAWPRLSPLSILSDILMLLNYVLNPILYVLMRQRRRLSLTNLCHSIAHCFKRSHKTSTESVSMKASCCPQETLVVSDSSGAEMRPLRAPVSLAPYDSQHAA
ncbi:prostacyclin receptor [Spodoptera frugiperda]|uniref:Prostacyclin receptor n=1 Tax=Spodoptera frugiperda TaxID=7108 RepID=A0A9R0DGY8_SPOFR|nr:prostacyclin receptor [Spodoptera frugiperda]XP_035453043.2 prostacyclin receptor [Spodoptera frugiperda]